MFFFWHMCSHFLCCIAKSCIFVLYCPFKDIYLPQNKKEIHRNLDISVPVFNSFSYSMRSISSRHTSVMHAVPSELHAAHEEGKIKYLGPEEVKKKKKHAWSRWLSQRKQLVASLPQQSVTLRRSRLAQVQDWFGEGGGVLIMTQRQSLNQPSLSMLISSILFLMNWLACERTGGNYSNWGEWQEQGRGWGRGVLRVSWMDERWMCVCVCLVGRFLGLFFTTEQSPGLEETHTMWITLWCSVRDKQLCCETFIFFASLKSLAESGRQKGARETKREM